MSKPAFVDGESIFGYLQRTSIPTTTPNLTYEGHGKVSLLFASAIESRFPWLSNLLPFETILEQHTPYKLFAAYLTRRERRYLKRHYLRKPARGVAHMTGLPSCGPKTAGRLKFCLVCMRHDIGHSGVCVIRVVHLLPGIIHCPIHFERLFEYCGECYEGFGTSHAVRPIQPFCRCGKPLKRVGPELDELSEAAMLAIAEDALAVLKGSLDGITAERMAAMRSRRAQEIGLISSGGLINHSVLKASINDAGLSQVVSFLGFSLNRKSVLVLSVSGKKAVRNYLVNLVADLLLFQGVDGLKQNLRLSSNKKAKPMLTEWEQKSLERGKEQILQSLTENPNVTRQELRRRHVFGRRMKVVLAHASSWLDEVVPRQRRGGDSDIPHLPQIDRRVDHEDDLKLVGNILKNYKKIRSESTIPPINTRRLLKDFPRSSMFKSLRGRYPLSALLLERLSESATRDTLKRRKIRVWVPEVQHPHMLPPWRRRKLIEGVYRRRREANA